MKFKRYSRGDVVAYAFDDRGAIGLRRPDGVGLLRTSAGIPRPVIEQADLVDVSTILACIVDGFDREACRKRGVEAAP